MNIHCFQKSGFCNFLKQYSVYGERYNEFLKVFNEVKEKDCKLSLKVYEMFERVVKFAGEDKINKFNFFIKQLGDFENVLGEKKVIERAKDIILQFESSVISENPVNLGKVAFYH